MRDCLDSDTNLGFRDRDVNAMKLIYKLSVQSTSYILQIFYWWAPMLKYFFILLYFIFLESCLFQGFHTIFSIISVLNKYYYD